MKTITVKKEWFNDQWHYFIYEDAKPIKAFFNQDEAEDFFNEYIERIQGSSIIRYFREAVITIENK